MTNLFTTIQSKYDPYFLGFNRVFDQLIDFDNQVDKSRGNYPPYNLIQDGDQYTIELAVAGFSENDIDITHEPEKSRITIAGSIGTSDGTYLHQGIANRNFSRTWTVADSVEVLGAELDGGILRVKLESVIPEEKKPKKITIKNSQLLNG
jgi:molecular chaperone IbpA